MQSGGSRQRHVRHRIAAARRRPSATAAPIVTVLVVVCAGLAGGQARAASPGASPSANPSAGIPSCVSSTAGSVTVSPYVIGNAQLPATFTTNDAYFAGNATYFDVYTLDCQKINVIPVGSGETQDVTFVGGSDLSCGPHYFDDKYYAGGSTPDQEFAGGFFISCITANPSTILSTQEPVSVTLTGSRFFADYSSFSVTVDGTQVSTTPTIDGRAGTVTTVITAQGLACGPHTVTLSEKLAGMNPIIATTTLTVQCPGSSNPPPGNPTMTANPTVVVDGDLTHVTGTGFTPGAPVTVTWQTTSGTVLYDCSANALTGKPLGADASGKIDTYCLALPHGEMGAEQIAGDQPAAGQTPAEHATVAVVVEGGSMQPSTGDQFVFRR
jgi:hypothetical protein